MPKDLFEEHGVDLLEQKPAQLEEPGFLNKLGKGYLNYAGGALRGMAQGAGDLGASAINWPISGIEQLLGAQLPHVPHPDLINKHPNSLGESLGQSLGQITGGMVLPGGAGFKAAQLANKGYQGLRAGKQLPLIGKLLAGTAGGALEGAAANEENRGTGAKIGAAFGGLGHAVPAAINFAKQATSKNLAKQIQNEFSNLNQHFGERFSSHIAAGEQAGANKFLRPERVDTQLLKKGGNGDLVYHLEKFNTKPTLENAHGAQSALGALERKYAMAPKGTVGADIHKEALKAKNRLLQKISQSFERAGVPEHAEGYHQSRSDFAANAAPYLNNPTIAGLLGRASKTGEQTVRPKKFAELFFQDVKPKEKFLSRKGDKHKELLQREKINSLLESKTGKMAAIAAGGALGSYLPHFITKAMESY